MRNRLNRQTLAAAVGLLALAAPGLLRAEKIYQYTDEDGVTVLTNVPPGKVRKGLRLRTEGEVTTVTNAPPPLATPRDDGAYRPFVEEACALYRIPVALARAVMAAESNFNPKAVSPKGAQGLMQLMPATALEMLVSDAFEPRQNILGGVRYLRVLANMFDGDMVRIVAAYNAGPEAVKRASGIPDIPETQEYVRRVLRLYYEYKVEAPPVADGAKT